MSIVYMADRQSVEGTVRMWKSFGATICYVSDHYLLQFEANRPLDRQGLHRPPLGDAVSADHRETTLTPS